MSATFRHLMGRVIRLLEYLSNAHPRPVGQDAQPEAEPEEEHHRPGRQEQQRAPVVAEVLAESGHEGHLTR